MLNQQQPHQSSTLDSTTDEVQLPRFRRFFSSRGGGGNRRRRFLAALPPYNYKTDCVGAQKLFYIGFVLSSIASVVFLISFVYNSSSRSRGGGGGGGGGAVDFKGGSAGSQWNDSTRADATSRHRRPELGLFETLALLCSAFGLCLIAGVFLCGLYVTRRRKDIEEQRLLAVTPTGMCGGGDDAATETSDLSSYSLSTRLDASGGRCSGCGAVNPRRRRLSRRHPLGDEFNNITNGDANSGRYYESDDDETDDDDASDREVEEAGGVGIIGEAEGGAAAFGAVDVVRRALGSTVPQLRRCTCGQIGTVSKASERRVGAEFQLPNSPERQQQQQQQQQHVIGLF